MRDNESCPRPSNITSKKIDITIDIPVRAAIPCGDKTPRIMDQSTRVMDGSLAGQERPTCDLPSPAAAQNGGATTQTGGATAQTGGTCSNSNKQPAYSRTAARDPPQTRTNNCPFTDKLERTCCPPATPAGKSGQTTETPCPFKSKPACQSSPKKNIAPVCTVVDDNDDDDDCAPKPPCPQQTTVMQCLPDIYAPPPLKNPVYQPPPELVPKRKERVEIPVYVPKQLKGGRLLAHECPKTNGLQNDCQVCGPYCDHYRPRDSHPRTNQEYNERRASQGKPPCCDKPDCTGEPKNLFKITPPNFPKPLLKGGKFYPGNPCEKRDGLQEDWCFRSPQGQGSSAQNGGQAGSSGADGGQVMNINGVQYKCYPM